jgi:poly(3-hydroxybutyrate) depolymerase
MCYAIACAMGDIVRAVAVHSGGAMSGCDEHDKPVAYFMTHGTVDSVCKPPSFGIPQLQDFAKTNGCTAPDPYQTSTDLWAVLPQPATTSPMCTEFSGCRSGYPVRACLFVGDHTWLVPTAATTWVPGETWSFISRF